jgi:hypothetical protein
MPPSIRQKTKINPLSENLCFLVILEWTKSRNTVILRVSTLSFRCNFEFTSKKIIFYRKFTFLYNYISVTSEFINSSIETRVTYKYLQYYVIFHCSLLAYFPYFEK